ncbi:protocadherin Fat 4-like protein [Dinothrombium tinctorium]|uniref:Protocadherin Fat 4-like protein n=1 Tax=Dinothrombium tinctorium TaxID=1965070 RepID=A0A3S3NW54_9ACAR|nr:protocadherin Fat 4-like protein [Dinothrombium tinctorium]RWS07204.1 protocadherin Fat 4-like protein [Dinothrombium tinctorium]
MDSVIGNVSTDPSDRDSGSIELSLAPNSPQSRLDGQEVPIKIKPGTKDLVLIRKLDKEGVEGEQGIVVGVRCKKLAQKNDPSIIIPVRIIVTDANDHAPEFLGTPYIVNVSEVTVVGSALVPAGKIRARDDDQQGPFSTVEYYVEPGPFSHMAKFESQLGGNLILTAPLDFETLPKFWLSIRCQDQGEPPNVATTTVTVNVLDADDQNPHFLDDKYTGKLPENVREGSQLIVSPRAVRAIDPDTDINSEIEYSFNFPSDSREYSFFHIDPKFGDITLKKPLPASLTLPLTLVIRATQVDNRDRYALTTLTVFSARKQMLAADVRFLQTNYSTSVLENLPPGQVLLTVQTTRGENNHREEAIQFQILDDEESHFSVRKNGEIVLQKSLDYELRPWYSFRVMASDGKQSDVARVNVTVLNVNDHDPQFSQNHYNFFVNEARLRNTTVVGEVRATDNDLGDTISLTIKGPFAKIFTITKEGLIKVKSLKNLNTSQCHLIVVATDSGIPPRSSSVPVTVQFSSGVWKAFNRSIDDIENMIDGLNEAESKSNENGSGVDMNMIFNTSGSSAIVLVIVLGVLLATLFIIIITLTVHVLKNKKFASASVSSSSSDSSENASPAHLPYNQHYHPSSRRSSSLASLGKSNRIAPLPEGRTLFLPTAVVPGLGMRGVENPIFNMPTTTNTISNLSSRYYSSPPNSSSNKSDPDSAIVSDASTNSRTDNNEAISKESTIAGVCSNRSISPPPPPPSITCNSGTIGGGTASRISVIKWPQGSIPRRVKKLTWEDEKFASLSVPNDERNASDHAYNEECNDYIDNNHCSSIQSNEVSSPINHTELDPDVSVTPLRRTFHHQNSVESGLPDLTVYF